LEAGNGCAGTGLGGLTPSQILNANATPEQETKAIYNYTVTHPDYNYSQDLELEDTGKFIVANAIFLGNADAASRQPNFWDRFKAGIQTLINSGAPVALTAIIVNGSDTNGDGRPDTQGGGRPRSNLAQNKQFQGAVSEIEAQLGRRLSKTEIQQLHYALHDLENPGFWQIVDEGLGMFK
jgi:hypothetical protein